MILFNWSKNFQAITLLQYKEVSSSCEKIQYWNDMQHILQCSTDFLAVPYRVTPLYIDLLMRFQHNKTDNTLHVIDVDVKNNYLVYYVHIFCDMTQKSRAVFLHEVWQRFIFFCNCNWSLKTSTKKNSSISVVGKFSISL